MAVYQQPSPGGTLRWMVDFMWVDPKTGRKRRIRRAAKDPKGRPAKSQTAAERSEDAMRAALVSGTFEAEEAEQSDVPTLANYKSTYLDDVATRLKPQSLEGKRRELNRLMALEGVATKRLDEIDATVVLDVTKALKARELGAKSINNLLSALRSMLAHAEEHQVIGAVPKFRWQKPPPATFDFFTFDEAAQLLQQAHPMAVLAVRTGMRIGELLAVRWGDISIERKHIIVSRSLWWGPGGEKHEGSPKNHKSRTIPLTSDALAALEKAKAERDDMPRNAYVFSDPAGSPLTMHACKWPLWRAQDAAGLRRTGWHVLRHTFASHLAMRGVALPAIQALMGHSTIQMTMKYAHLAPDHLRGAIDALEAGSRPPAWSSLPQGQ